MDTVEFNKIQFVNLSHENWGKVIRDLEATLGVTDPYSKFRDRPWYTTPDHGVFIRQELPTPAIITFLLLKNGNNIYASMA